MLVLRFTSGPLAGQRIRVKSETLLGRENADITIEDPEISRRHVIIRPSGVGFEIEDVGSLNGTSVNNALIRSAIPLADGDVIEIGGSSIEVGVPARPRTAAPSGASDLSGTRLGTYELEEVISQDATFTIYKAYQDRLDRHVAVKILIDPQSAEFGARFRLEAKILARLQHPNIVPIYDHGEQDGLLYLVTQYLDSEMSLGDMVGEPMEATLALRLTAQVLSALDFAHRNSVVHRNVKPANVMMPLPTWPMLAGFDIAKVTDERRTRGLTQQGMVIGTPAYMAPEQAFGLTVDGRADIYSTGVLLFELVTGRVPFKGDTPQATLSMHAYDEPPRLRSIVPAVPAELEPLVARALEKEASRRYQKAADMGEKLQQVAAVVERSTGSDPLVELYEAGVRAFQRGQWDRACERLGRLVTLDPEYEDAESLLEVAMRERGSGR
ncbi:MAG: protein kinase [Actinomycetota bacterium]